MLMCKVQVARAIEMRQIVTSLGPAYIKLGQALSIRPDLLSPAAMVEMQKLCDKACPCRHTHLDQDAKRLRPKDGCAVCGASLYLLMYPLKVHCSACRVHSSR